MRSTNSLFYMGAALWGIAIGHYLTSDNEWTLFQMGAFFSTTICGTMWVCASAIVNAIKEQRQ